MRAGRVVAVEVRLLEGRGEEGLHGILGIGGRQVMVDPDVLIRRSPVTGDEVVERGSPRRIVMAANPLEDGASGGRKHDARVSRTGRRKTGA